MPDTIDHVFDASSASNAARSLSVLMATGTAGGTIAAVRQLGAAGVNVGVLASPGLCAAAWSRFTSCSIAVPPENETERFLQKLIAIGMAAPGQILLPTSDETLWLYSEHSQTLARHFLLNQPSLECVRRILDKKLFAEAVQSVALPVIPAWEPNSFEEVEDIAAALPYPILIKPRTHVRRLRKDKGIVVESPEQLKREYRKFVNREVFLSRGASSWKVNTLPLLQRFVHVGREGVCSVSGYIDRSGELFVTRRSTKIMQRSQPAGVGICFESLPPDPQLSQSVRRLCKELGYFGIFEVEFLKWDGRWTPIDFNGRLFHQVGLDVQRGMPLPLFACLEAAGRLSELEQEIVRAQTCDRPGAFRDGFTFHALAAARRLTGRTSASERAFWKHWSEENAMHLRDVVYDNEDRRPVFFHIVSEIHSGLKALPRFLRTTTVEQDTLP